MRFLFIPLGLAAILVGAFNVGIALFESRQPTEMLLGMGACYLWLAFGVSLVLTPWWKNLADKAYRVFVTAGVLWFGAFLAAVAFALRSSGGQLNGVVLGVGILSAFAAYIALGIAVRGRRIFTTA